MAVGRGKWQEGAVLGLKEGGEVEREDYPGWGYVKEQVWS